MAFAATNKASRELSVSGPFHTVLKETFGAASIHAHLLAAPAIDDLRVPSTEVRWQEPHCLASFDASASWANGSRRRTGRSKSQVIVRPSTSNGASAVVVGAGRYQAETAPTSPPCRSHARGRVRSRRGRSGRG